MEKPSHTISVAGLFYWIQGKKIRNEKLEMRNGGAAHHNKKRRGV